MESVVYPQAQPIIIFIPAYKADLYEASAAEVAAAAAPVHQIEYAAGKTCFSDFFLLYINKYV